MQWKPLAEITIAEWENLEQSFTDPTHEPDDQHVPRR